jgi:hypothetical protein
MEGFIKPNRFFTKDHLRVFFEHCLLKTKYEMNYTKVDRDESTTIDFYSHNTFTSHATTFNLNNIDLGSQVIEPKLRQYINLNKIIYTSNDDAFMRTKYTLFRRFYTHYLKDKDIGEGVNKLLVDIIHRYQECLSLINVEYKSACIQAIDLVCLNRNKEYLFQVYTDVEPIINILQ